MKVQQLFLRDVRSIKSLDLDFRDPVTGKPEWGLIKAPDGAIMGVHSLSTAAPIKRAGFLKRDETFKGAARYADWRFVHEPVLTPERPVQAPAAKK